jgi:hypothetical protein
VTCVIHRCKPCEVTYILHYLPQGDESSPRGSWGICAQALPEVLTEVEIAEATVEKRNPRFKEGEIFDPVEKEILVEREVKLRENRQTAQRSWRKMGRQIRGHLKPNTLERRKLMHVEVSKEDGKAWTKI